MESSSPWEQQRLRTVARTFLERGVKRPPLMVVAGSDEEEGRAAAGALVRAAKREMLPLQTHGLATMAEEAADPPLEDRACPQLFFHGRIDERRLAELRPPIGEGPDLLLWILPRQLPCSLRSMYFLGMWSWSLSPRRVHCLLPPSSLGRKETESALQDRLDALGLGNRFETIALAETWESQATDLIFGQILQSVLSSIRRGTRIAAASLLLGLLTVASGTLARAQQESGTMMVEEFEPNDQEGERGAAGGHLLVGPYQTVDPGPRVGEGSANGPDVRLPTDRRRPRLRHRGREVAGDDLRILVSMVFVPRGPQFTIVSWLAKLSAEGSTVHIQPLTCTNALPGRVGFFPTAMLFGLVLLLFLRASSMQRKLATPRSSPGPPGRGRDPNGAGE